MRIGASPTSERSRKRRSLSFSRKPGTEGDTRTARGLVKCVGLNPIVVQPIPHLRQKIGAIIATDMANFDDVTHGDASLC
jgi:hypothetical protein